MPSQDASRAPGPEPSGSARGLSRRSLLQGAAAASAAGLAATALGATAMGAAASPALAATSRPPAPDQSRAHDERPAGPIVVHVRDARTGDIEVFSGTSQSRVRDQDLAARIARAIS